MLQPLTDRPTPGLADDHPTLTTYFEGEIIGNKYNFITQHPEWGSNEKVDRQHWARFPAYKPSKPSSRPDAVAKDWMQKEHLFMRWKEYFLVPDHRVKTISGASFEGFYYIAFEDACDQLIARFHLHHRGELRGDDDAALPVGERLERLDLAVEQHRGHVLSRQKREVSSIPPILHHLDVNLVLTSSRFQKLQLEHVEDHGCQGAYEFR